LRDGRDARIRARKGEMRLRRRLQMAATAATPSGSAANEILGPAKATQGHAALFELHSGCCAAYIRAAREAALPGLNGRVDVFQGQ